MKLYIVFAQRKERYAGEYAPEALAIVTEYDRDENPEWIVKELEKAKSNDDFVSADIFLVDLGNEAVALIRSHLLDYPGLTGAVTVEAA